MSNKSQRPGSTDTKSRQAATPATRSPMLWVIPLILFAGVMVVIVAASSRSSGDSTADGETAFAEVLGTPLPAFSEPDPAVGLEAPVISAQTFQGDRVQITNDGMARMYGFFAHWCPHCQDELPATVEWLETNTLPDGVEIVAISTSVDPGAPNYPPSEWFEDEEWPATVVVDDPESVLAQGFGLTAFPFWVAVDADGNVVSRVSGALSTQQFESLVDQITPAT